MRIFYFMLLAFLGTGVLSAQISKPLHIPNDNATTVVKKNLKPVSSSIYRIPAARRNILTTFRPTTQPTLKRSNRMASGLRITARSKEGRPIMIQGELEDQPTGRSLQEQVFHYLDAIKGSLKISEPRGEFSIIEQKTDDLGHTHFKLQQIYKGIKVYGGEVWLHSKNNQIALFNGRNHSTPELKKINPDISLQEARKIALDDLSVITTNKILSAQDKQLIGNIVEPQLVIFHNEEQQQPVLAWHLYMIPNVASQWEYLVDAQTGQILDKFKTLCRLHYSPKDEKENSAGEHFHGARVSKEGKPGKSHRQTGFFNGPASTVATDLNNFNRTLHSYEIDGYYFLIDASRDMFNGLKSELPHEPVGAIWTIDAQNTFPGNDDFNAIHVVTSNNNWNDQLPVSAHYNAGIAYEYFKNTFNRNSINGGGGNIISVINVSDEDGSSFENAFWSGSAMFYGNGGNEFLPLAKSLDVAAHEMSHGVIQNTANLRYQGESGAMNESFADIFAVLVDRDDWQLGEEVVNPNLYRTGALRDLQNPNNGGNRLGDRGWQPAHVSEQYLGREDNGGVHINSGIVNHAFYLIANTIGRAKAEQIYYRALSTYLVSSSQFADLRASLLQSATDIHGSGSNEVTVIAAAFDQVGILGSDTGSGNNSGGEVPEVVEANPGEDFIIFTDDNQANLYLADGQGNILLSPLTTSGILSRPSITDDGVNIVFVADDKTIHLITIDWDSGDVFEEIIQEEPIWRNAAVARDGSRVAALTEEINNQIDIFDFGWQEWKTYELYNPTFTEGVRTGEVNYADVIEFDFSGEFVMYDANNSIRGDFGADDIEYWDIGFVKVYDYTIDYFEQNVDNNIIKLFSGLEENISIGNPTFSKNSPNILAFDYIDGFEGSLELRGINLFNNRENTIRPNSVLSVPSYSRLDNQIIFNGQTTLGNNVVATVPVGEDKISAAGDAAILVSQAQGAQLGVWFSDGSRQLTSAEDADLVDIDLQFYPNPFSDQLLVKFNLKEGKELNISLSNTLGQVLLNKPVRGMVGNNQEEIDTHLLPPGTYYISIQSDVGMVSSTLIKI